MPSDDDSLNIAREMARMGSAIENISTQFTSIKEYNTELSSRFRVLEQTVTRIGTILENMPGEYRRLESDVKKLEREYTRQSGMIRIIIGLLGAIVAQAAALWGKIIYGMVLK